MIVPLRGVGPAVYASPFSKILFPFLAVAIDISLGAFDKAAVMLLRDSLAPSQSTTSEFDQHLDKGATPEEVTCGVFDKRGRVTSATL